jgi:cell division protein FtsW
MMIFSRTDNSLFGRWWWTVDRWLLAALGLLIVFGAFLVTTASPAVANRIGLDGSYFVTRQFLLLLPAVLGMLAISLFSPRQILLLAGTVYTLGITAMIMVLLVGMEIKGARRWIHLPGFSLQPSEFVKPAFIVLNAWLLSHPAVRSMAAPKLLPLGLLLLTTCLLMLQPDLGMTMVIGAVWLAQLFLAGLPMILVFIGMGFGLTALVGAYFALPHVSSRIDRFLNPESGDSYQVDRALDAFQAGGLFGVGPGQGTVKETIPDAHADFIFAVAGEELGLVWCLALLALIAFIVLRGFYRSGQGPTLFVTLAGSGLIVQFAMQALVNIGSSLHLLPTKGMTLPFVSYGGSSLLAMGIGMGMLLAITRKRTHNP